jgi:hypothetical protein
MNYNYSQINEIIEKQYAKKKGDKDKSNWFWEESIKYGKGYSKTGEYLQAIAKNAMMDRSKNDIIIEDKALYLDEKR